jgi:hypothetical protein
MVSIPWEFRSPKYVFSRPVRRFELAHKYKRTGRDRHESIDWNSRSFTSTNAFTFILLLIPFLFNMFKLTVALVAFASLVAGASLHVSYFSLSSIVQQQHCADAPLIEIAMPEQQE